MSCRHPQAVPYSQACNSVWEWLTLQKRDWSARVVLKRDRYRSMCCSPRSRPQVSATRSADAAAFAWTSVVASWEGARWWFPRLAAPRAFPFAGLMIGAESAWDRLAGSRRSASQDHFASPGRGLDALGDASSESAIVVAMIHRPQALRVLA